jgi:hypothetical protein
VDAGHDRLEQPPESAALVLVLMLVLAWMPMLLVPDLVIAAPLAVSAQRYRVIMQLLLESSSFVMTAGQGKQKG